MSSTPPLLPAETEGAFGFLLHYVARLLRGNFNRRVQALGLTQAQCRVLLHLSRNEGIQQVALAEILEVQPVTLARLLDKLQAAGLIERRRDGQDRRAFCLWLQQVLTHCWRKSGRWPPKRAPRLSVAWAMRKGAVLCHAANHEGKPAQGPPVWPITCYRS